MLARHASLQGHYDRPETHESLFAIRLCLLDSPRDMTVCELVFMLQ